MKRPIDWLSARERQVLLHLMQGRTAEEIAAQDYVSITTVRSQIRSILMKLNVTSQVAAVAAGYAACWDSVDEWHEAMALAVA